MTDIAIRQSDDWVPMVEPLVALAERLALTPFAGAARGKPADVFATILYGRELSLSPAQSLQLIHMVQGRPTLSAEGHRALFLSSGHRLDIVDWTDKQCSVRATRGDGRGTVEVTFTLKQAEAAGLLKNPSWRAWPQQMLLARATSMAIKAIAPDVSLGLEAGDSSAGFEQAPATSTTTVVQVQTPPRPDSERLLPEPSTGAPEMQGSLPSPEPVTVPAPPESDSPAPVAVPPPDMISGPQRRKIGALIGQLEKHDGHRMDRQERRDFIAALLQVEHLESANDLTRAQAGDVIDRLEALLKDTFTDTPTDIPGPEIVDAEVVE